MKEEDILVLVDNGHGDPPKGGGKCSPDKRLKEYYYCREIAPMVTRLLSLKGYDARLLTPETADVSLSERIRRVNAWCAKLGASNVLLISIHNNAAKNDGKWHDARGFEVYVSKNASERSKRLAGIFTSLAKEKGLMGNRSVPQSGCWTWSWRKDDIAILSKTKCAAVLTENLFQDNEEDVSYLLSDKGKETIARLHFEAIMKYLQS